MQESMQESTEDKPVWGGYYDSIKLCEDAKNLDSLDPIFKIIENLEETKTVKQVSRILRSVTKTDVDKLNSPLLDGLYSTNLPPIINAAYMGSIDAIKFLLKRGAKLHCGHDKPLRFAAKRGHVEVVKFLLSKGAELKYQKNKTLILSAQNGHFDMVKFFIEKGMYSNKIFSSEFCKKLVLLDRHEIIALFIEKCLGQEKFSDFIRSRETLEAIYNRNSSFLYFYTQNLINSIVRQEYDSSAIEYLYNLYSDDRQYFYKFLQVYFKHTIFKKTDIFNSKIILFFFSKKIYPLELPYNILLNDVFIHEALLESPNFCTRINILITTPENDRYFTTVNVNTILFLLEKKVLNNSSIYKLFQKNLSGNSPELLKVLLENLYINHEIFCNIIKSLFIAGKCSIDFKEIFTKVEEKKFPDFSVISTEQLVPTTYVNNNFSLELLKYLKEKKIRFSDLTFREACKHSSVEIIDFLVKNGGYPVEELKNGFSYAIECNTVDNVIYFRNKFNVKYTCCNEDKNKDLCYMILKCTNPNIRSILFDLGGHIHSNIQKGNSSPRIILQGNYKSFYNAYSQKDKYSL